MHLCQNAAQPTSCWAGRSIPEACGQGGMRGGGVCQDTPRQQCQCREALSTLRGENALPGRPQHLLGPEGQPCHRPAVPIQRLRLRATEGQGCLES